MKWLIIGGIVVIIAAAYFVMYCLFDAGARADEADEKREREMREGDHPGANPNIGRT